MNIYRKLFGYLSVVEWFTCQWLHTYVCIKIVFAAGFYSKSFQFRYFPEITTDVYAQILKYQRKWKSNNDFHKKWIYLKVIIIKCLFKRVLI